MTFGPVLNCDPGACDVAGYDSPWCDVAALSKVRHWVVCSCRYYRALFAGTWKRKGKRGPEMKALDELLLLVLR